MDLRSLRDEIQDDPFGLRRVCGPKNRDSVPLEGGRGPQHATVGRRHAESAALPTQGGVRSRDHSRPFHFVLHYSC